MTYGTECECGTEHDWRSFEEVLDYAMDETNSGCCRATAKAVLMCVRPVALSEWEAFWKHHQEAARKEA